MKHRALPQPAAGQASESLGQRWLAAMRAGDFEAAWAVSDRVLAARDPAGRDNPRLPYHLRWVWDGRPFDGADVLVRCYHGLGDTLQFCRYLAPLRRRIRGLTVEAQPVLIPLLSRVPGPDRIVAFRPDRPCRQSECDLEIMELAHALRIAPDPAPYLAVAAERAGGEGLLAGVCWEVTTTWSPERSIPLELLTPLSAIPGLTLYTLQRGTRAELPGAANPEGCPASLLDTARLIAGLDVVVTVDTMVAHLAGAMGIPVALLLIAEPDWRWLPGGRGSPWYGSVRKYRQDRPGEWDAPVAALTADLTRAARDHSLAGTQRLVGGL